MADDALADRGLTDDRDPTTPTAPRDEVTAGGLSITIVGDPAVYARLIGRALDEGADLKAAETIAAALAQPAQIVAEAQRVMAPGLAQFTADVEKAEAVLGCSYEEIVDRVPNMPSEYGETTPSDVVEAGEMGYRGEAALDLAASWHRPLPTANSPRIVRPRTCRPRRAARARGTARRAPKRATRGSPRSRTDDDPHPEPLVRLAEALA